MNKFSGVDKVVVINGKTLISFIIPSGSSAENFPVSPVQLGTRLTALATCFQEFRFTRLDLKLHPYSVGTSVASSTTLALGYFKALNGGSAINQQDVYQSPVSRFITIDDTVPVSMPIGRSNLLGGVRPWYKNFGDTGDENEDKFQGEFVIAANTAVSANLSYVVECSYSVEFRGACDPQEDFPSYRSVCGAIILKSMKEIMLGSKTMKSEEVNKSELTASKIVDALIRRTQ